MSDLIWYLRSPMAHSLLLAGVLAGFSGCQCCRLTEPYLDTVDHVAEHEGWLEWMYCNRLDLTRVGRRDWCSYRLNNWLCPCRCNQCPPVACPTYMHLGYGWENRHLKKSMPVEAMPDDAGVPGGNYLPEPTIPMPTPELPSPPPAAAPSPEPVMMMRPVPAPYYEAPPVAPVMLEAVPASAVVEPAPDASLPKGVSNSEKRKPSSNYVTPISGRK